MTSGDWQQVRQIFHAALDVPPEARLAFVQAQTEDARVVQEVHSLLRAHPAAEGFLSTPAAPGAIAAAAPHLRPGDRLGSFEVLGLLGSGGMGEVYRARDTRLDWDVAIKVLSSSVGDDGRQRLEREARAIARLAHPRVCTLHDVGSARIGERDATYLVMELVDGETLAARLGRGPLPVAPALGVAIDVAEALVAAHGAGLVHRDLKPANVMLTRTGAKLLDFGLARPGASPVGGNGASAVPASSGPPVSVLAGTPPYMAPEQMQGADADARSDLFAFGATLYEMLTGTQAFEAGPDGDVQAAILEREPAPLTERAPLAPPALARIVATCLAKDRDERWQTAKDLLRELRWLKADLATHAPALAGAGAVSRRGVVLAATMAVAVLGTAAVAVMRSSPAAPTRVSFVVPPPEGTRFPRGTIDMAVSPDGSRLVFGAMSADGTWRLWLRRFDAVESHAITGSEGARFPFWSPDGRWIAFFSGGKLKRIPEAGGLAQDVCDVRRPLGGAWSPNGTILFGAFQGTLFRVPASGGPPAQVTALDASLGHNTHGWPVFLPDGQRFLFLAFSDDPAQAAVYQGTLDAADTRRVVAAESRVAVTGGHLLSLSKGVLVARPYDPARVPGDGASITIADHIASDTPQRAGSVFAAAGRVVAFRSASADSRLIWRDRMGNQVGAFPLEADWHHPWLSPDDTRVAVEKTDPARARHTIWILDVARGTASRLLDDWSGAHLPVWSPDGHRVLFASNRLGGVDLFQIAADGSAPDTLVHRSREGNVEVTDWSLDGRLALYQTNRHGNYDILAIPLSGAGGPRPLLETTANGIHGQCGPTAAGLPTRPTNPDPPKSSCSGSWRRLKVRVSTRGGAQPRWRRDGRELYYLAPDGGLMALPVTARAD